MKRLRLFLTAVAMLVVTSVQAKPSWVKKAQALGCEEIQNCASCHTSEKPKKGDPLGDRGKWLVEEKNRLKADEVDLAWLKRYPKKG